jgi:hypothetical protein
MGRPSRIRRSAASHADGMDADNLRRDAKTT